MNEVLREFIKRQLIQTTAYRKAIDLNVQVFMTELSLCLFNSIY